MRAAHRSHDRRLPSCSSNVRQGRVSCPSQRRTRPHPVPVLPRVSDACHCVIRGQLTCKDRLPLAQLSRTRADRGRGRRVPVRWATKRRGPRRDDRVKGTQNGTTGERTCNSVILTLLILFNAIAAALAGDCLGGVGSANSGQRNLSSKKAKEGQAPGPRDWPFLWRTGICNQGGSDLRGR